MNPCFIVIVLFHFTLATAVNLEHVFEWPNGMDYEWPSEANRTQALNEGTFKPEKIEPIFMAVYGTRIFLSLDKYYARIPVSLVSLPTRSASSASPKLTPLPSWDMHGKGDCNKIEEARGLQVDSVGRLWVLDSGSGNCNAKLWFIHLSNMDQTELIHRFHYRGHTQMIDFVLDETPNGSLAYISSRRERHIVVFSLETKQSWLLGTSGIEVSSIALSPKWRTLYLSKFNSKELYSISLTTLRKETRTANPKLVGNWNARPYRILMDSHGTMFAAFVWKNYLSSFNTSQPFQEQRFYEVEKVGTTLPFTLALDSLSGTFWMTEHYKTESKPRFRLLKGSCILIENSNEHRILIITLICSNVLLSLFILWLILGPKIHNLFTQYSTINAMLMSVFFNNNK